VTAAFGEQLRAVFGRGLQRHNADSQNESTAPGMRRWLGACLPADVGMIVIRVEIATGRISARM
jgi:hypothetical protein